MTHTVPHLNIQISLGAVSQRVISLPPHTHAPASRRSPERLSPVTRLPSTLILKKKKKKKKKKIQLDSHGRTVFPYSGGLRAGWPMRYRHHGNLQNTHTSLPCAILIFRLVMAVRDGGNPEAQPKMGGDGPPFPIFPRAEPSSPRYK
jgi:hypothetical protein